MVGNDMWRPAAAMPARRLIVRCSRGRQVSLRPLYVFVMYADFCWSTEPYLAENETRSVCYVASSKRTGGFQASSNYELCYASFGD